MQLSTGTEFPVVFTAGENPVMQLGSADAGSFGAGECWPNS
jgi:hypothetical protein